jgi:tetratricopeptide (TPR) repeat protein
MRIAVFLSSIVIASLAFAGPHLDKALELYKADPSAADKITREINLELADDPESCQALLLLAITQRGEGKFDNSLATLDRVEKLDQKKGSLHSWVFILRAENYYFKKDYEKARKVLKAYWAFFEDSEEKKRRAEELSEAVQNAIKAEEEKLDNDAIRFVRISTGIASQFVGSREGYFAIYVRPKDWSSLSNDGDIGPFLKARVGKARQRAVILMPPNLKHGIACCVYFDAADAVQVVSISANASGKFESEAIKSALKEVTKEMLKPGKDKLHFTPVTLRTDDDKPLDAFEIAGAGKR